MALDIITENGTCRHLERNRNALHSLNSNYQHLYSLSLCPLDLPSCPLSKIVLHIRPCLALHLFPNPKEFLRMPHKQLLVLMGNSKASFIYVLNVDSLIFSFP